MPTTANPSGRSRSQARFRSAGMSKRFVRSPEAPRITRTPGAAGLAADVAAEREDMK
jgi:hypothetical protein